MVDRALDNAMAEARQAVVVLTASRQPTSGFRYLLETYLNDYAGRHELSIAFRASGPEIPLDSRQEAELLRIFREALNNVAKHAHATAVVMTFEAEETGLLLTLADNGKGFRLSEVQHGFGITSMEQRAASIGAQLAIDSRPMDGARVTVILPRASTEA